MNIKKIKNNRHFLFQSLTMNQIKHTLKPSEKTLKSKSPNLQQIKHTQNHKTTEKTILKPKKTKTKWGVKKRVSIKSYHKS